MILIYLVVYTTSSYSRPKSISYCLKFW